MKKEKKKEKKKEERERERERGKKIKQSREHKKRSGDTVLSSRLVRSVVRLWRSLDGGVASQTISHGLPASEVVRPRSAVPEADAIPDVSQDDELRKEEPALVGDIT